MELVCFIPAGPGQDTIYPLNLRFAMIDVELYVLISFLLLLSSALVNWI